jgi:xylulokinase
VTLVAGIDSSTQSCKVVVRDLETGSLVREGRAPHPSGTEVNPHEWWEALLEAVADAGGLFDVASISVAAQQHGMVVLDQQGVVIRPALLWNDTRSADAAEELIEEFGRSSLAQRTGSVPVASFTATKLRWLRNAEPENAKRVAAVTLPHDWLTWRLLGYGPENESPLGPDFSALVTDRSDASGTSYWSPSTGAYDEEILRWALGHVPALPRVLEPGARSGTTAPGNAKAIPEGVVVGPGAGDNAAAALGLGASVGDVIVSIGTSGTVYAITSEPVIDPTGTVAGFADATGAFLPLVATLNAARILESIAELLGINHTELGELARHAQPGSGGLVLQPYFEGERTPNLPHATATLFDMTLASLTRANLARAAIEGMLCGLADGLDAIRACGVIPERILLIGGSAANTAVTEVAAQVFDVPVSVPEMGEYVANGAARQAAWSYLERPVRWELAVASHPAMDLQPKIRDQYARHRSRTTGE